MRSIILCLILFSGKCFAGNEKQISFKENKGQVRDQNAKARPDVLFSGAAGEMIFHLKTTGVSYQLSRVDSWKEKENGFKASAKVKIKVPDKLTIYRLDIDWKNINKNIQVQKGKALSGCDNYYKEYCPEGITNIKSYEDITYLNLYNGIDLHYYNKDGNLKYDYIVQPNAEYRQIAFTISGAEKIYINKKGELVVETPLGIIMEEVPLVFQEGKAINAKWLLKENTVSFSIGNYDPSKELIIDPMVRLWGTYYGGGWRDRANACITDNSGNVYLTGYACTPDPLVIATSGSYQSSWGGGNNTGDAFLVKFDGNGNRLWGTYLGGTNDDQAHSCCVDPSGNIYITGVAESPNGIATGGSHQSNFITFATQEAFLAKFNSNGIIRWSTYYGMYNAKGYSCCTDNFGNVYMCGMTYTGTWDTTIATPGCHQPIPGSTGSNSEGFLVKFDSLGSRKWGTYYGGSSYDAAYSCATDGTGSLYLGGDCASLNNIASTGAYLTTNGDGFLAKFNLNGVRQWATYYESVPSCTVDKTGNIYLTGTVTYSASTIVATNASSHQSSWGGGNYDAYLSKFNPAGSFLWGTFYGGTNADYGLNCAIDNKNNVYLTGKTMSPNAIATAGSYQNTLGGFTDSYFAQFDSTGVRKNASYYGGSSDEDASDIAADNSGNIFMSGYTISGSGISTPASHQPTIGGDYDAFLVKFCSGSSIMATSSASAICSGKTLTLSASGATNYTWSTGSNSAITTTTAVNNNPFTPTLNVIYSVSGYTNNCPAAGGSVSVTVYVTPSVNISVSNQTICTTESDTLIANCTNYTGTFSWTAVSIISPSVIVSPTVNTIYTVTATNANSCSGYAFATVVVNPCVGIKEIHENNTITVFPNPTNEIVFVRSETENRNQAVKIFNALGQEIANADLKNKEAELKIPDAAGIYIMKIFENDKAILIKKIIKN